MDRPVGRLYSRYMRGVVAPVFSPRTWLAMVYLVSGLPVAIVTFTVLVVGIVLGVGLVPLALVPPSDPGWLPRLRAILLDGSRWRQALAGIVALPVVLIGFALTIGAWALALALITLPAYNGALPRRGADVFGHVLRGAPTMVASVVIGVVVVLLSPYLTIGVTRASVWIDRVLLRPGRRGDLAARVGDLERSRSRLVVAAEAERRRIERDLHDGAQARLVSLAMELGRAKARLAHDPEGAAALVSQAHEEAKAALVELRSLVRGVHPPVLSDRGLDAALSGLAALCPVPVAVDVDLPQRPSPTVEAIAYFVVAEALTNIAKHSGASTAAVHVKSSGKMLRVVVDDDGRGGADRRGAGLSGLADRVQAVDGRLTVNSPPGGPTEIEAELPCEW
jgi:signal transduction histidine kinase